MTPSTNHADALDHVSRETLHGLELYCEELLRWNSKINLVARSTESGVWDRHVVDSMQVYDLMPTKAVRWVDLGAGAGLPGLIVAILAKELDPDLEVVLVESDKRKSAFLAHVVRLLNLSATICSNRIDMLSPQAADVISARALAPLPKLLEFSHRHAGSDCVCLFHKGANVQSEIDLAKADWQFTHKEYKSKTDPSGVILRIEGLTRAAAR